MGPYSGGDATAALGPNGLFDLTRANVQQRRIAPDLERTILTLSGQRLASQVHPGTRYSLIGASTILAELQAVHIRPLPSLRTIERVLQRNGGQCPQSAVGPLHCQPDLPSAVRRRVQSTPSGGQRWPALLERQPATLLHLRRQRCLRWRRLPETLPLAQDGGHSRLPGRVLEDAGAADAQVQFDNAREVVGWGPAARYLSRVLRVCLRFGWDPILIPPASPQRNGQVGRTSMAGSNRACSNDITPR